MAASQAINLHEFIDKSRVAALNNWPQTKRISRVLRTHDSIKPKNVLASNPDVDEQILLFVPFSETVKIQGISVNASVPPKVTNEDGDAVECSGPATIKVFLNKPNVDFSDVEDMEPVWACELDEKSIDTGEMHKVKAMKFTGVKVLTIFIESNQDEADCTYFNNISFFGVSEKGTNIAKLKKTPRRQLFEKIVDNLWLGNIKSASDSPFLLKNGITHMVSILGRAPAVDPKIKHKHFKLSDVPDADISVYFEESTKFITDAIAGGGNVMVHCHAGISRSVTLVCCYLMYSRKIKAQAALAIVKKARPAASPNYGFWERLLALEDYLEGQQGEAKLDI